MGSEHDSSTPIHALLVSFPGQGHINPLLRLGKRLASKGFFVTFSTPETTGQNLKSANAAVSSAVPLAVGAGSLRFEFFDDGWSLDDPRRKNLSEYLSQLEITGKQFITQIINKHKIHHHKIPPISLIINNPFVPWVCDVAFEMGIPNAMLWVQSGAVFAAYYHYHHKLVPFPTESNPNIEVEIPCLPVLKNSEIPSFLLPSDKYKFLGSLILEQFKNLTTPFCVLMDTFEELEKEYIDYMGKFVPLRSVGPLFLNPRKTEDDGDSRIRGDLMVKAEDCVEWLNKKDVRSVVYVSFGSIVYLAQEQVEEIAYALLDSEVSFLWVLKPPHKDLGLRPHVLPDGFLEKTREKGKVVEWSPQEEVLSHPSISCFVSHCGWNSSMEALTCGVPIVTFPAWGDQVTNAKFLVDVFGVGIALGFGQSQTQLITRHEFKQKLQEATVGPKAQELRNNAMKWKAAAEAAVAPGGSSDRNLDEFVEDVKKRTLDSNLAKSIRASCVVEDQV